ncbi:aldose 1-epimerase [Streptomyces sp. MBT56]|uniref:aldose epimerase family protein n=1 Tax=Streptomyces sp. MBT56 TaxID=1488387 RepID=UPI00190D18C4|nr:aldose 1-epimerase [Streptomyces sp. MBT56]MBK3556769.1 aldose 1-epimerase [Streptomyces sp. MBT56]
MHGCRISSLRIGSTELLRQGDRYGCFPMVPWCGRTGYGQFRNGDELHELPLNSPPHAIHGTGRDTSWHPAHTAADLAEGRAAFYYDLAKPWPYEGRVTQTFELTEDTLTLGLAVETYGDSFPASRPCQAASKDSSASRPSRVRWNQGCHRTLGRDAELSFDAAWQEERGGDHLPTGRRIDPQPGPWDDCFGMPDGVDVRITWPERLELTVKSRSEWVVVYDEQDEAVCVEPQSGPPNGLNTTPRLVTPIDPLEMTTTWSWTRL